MHSSLQHLTPGSSGVSSLASQRVLPKCLWKVARRHADFGPDRSRHRGSLRSRAAAETPLGGSSLQGVSPQHAGNGNGEGEGPGPGSGKLHPRDYPKFVQFFRHASPYIAGHRGRTFVIVIPGNVAAEESLLRSTMSDIAQLHGLGVRLVLVIGAQPLIDNLLRQRGMQPAWVGGYRVTSQMALKAAVEAAGQVRISCEQFLSKGPAIPMIRRHTKGSGEEIHFEPALRVVSGNYVAAKRRGVVDGVDFGYTGEVRFVLKEDIHRQLKGGNVVLLSNLGFTAGGDVLNCNTFEVGLHAALELGADKLFNIHMDEVSRLQLPPWLPLSDAQNMLIKTLQETLSSEDLDTVRANMVASPEPAAGAVSDPATEPESALESESDQEEDVIREHNREGSPLHSTTFSHHSTDLRLASPAVATRIKSRLANSRHSEILKDLDVWRLSGFPSAVSSSVIACCKGVKRAHLLDARLDGGLLLELYSRDGVGTMISADFYEGIRKAGPGDLDAIVGLLRPLEDAGILVRRSREDLANLLQDFTVVERETKVMGCALLLDLGKSEDGTHVAELGAFCVDPVFRGSGRGDSLLDYVEQEARAKGMERLVLLTTRTADWFEQRDFKLRGPAALSALLPSQRRAKINPARNSQLYVKELEAPDEISKPPGKRIGF
uniref:amino-acid N-acetyltransferase n=1 Tax=Dunaliella tertiolecta TaxID=3047 RepID=A0A7S3RA34_DUNTE|mmetsp:Transcript_14167/g.38363  ORF Transcript_14167/g.38363 Transcript_14167/m.38363 type:complete len:662 (-) Transcript_14167:980-2965(-)|eukprot:CAMPEP_0202340356 /NCGR_PEP_ID=MMETSP1126-20121109/1828_1 /ASSEMBLY_ACC=CAM_ASM_000457 /TAXON_ID=3047 /ORGANISM="Dunaliella tertiolecta, Strain CCMP1320" /LENGTH=661 /DNA_ID=CAMNT_0048931045 /DNA_START=116 /DNA_END=2101 /DNA_ORIENTATION=-